MKFTGEVKSPAREGRPCLAQVRPPACATGSAKESALNGRFASFMFCCHEHRVYAPLKRKEHRTSNIQHPTSNSETQRCRAPIGRSMLDVGCSMFCHCHANPLRH